MNWWEVVLAVLVALVVLWLVFLAAVLIFKPSRSVLKQALRFGPDLVRLVSRLARDPKAPNGVRFALVFLGLYLASPVDLIPDFIPLLGYADDAAVILIVLRQVLRSIDSTVVAKHWPGGREGLLLLYRICGVETNDKEIGK